MLVVPRGLQFFAFFFSSSFFLFSHSMVKMMKLIGPIVALELCRYVRLTWIHGRTADGSGGVEWGRLNLDGKQDNYIFL